MRIFKKLVIFFLLNILFISFFHIIFNQPSIMDLMIRQYAQGDYNEVILGQSEAETGLNPYILSTDEEHRVYNFAYRYSAPHDNLYLLKELNSIRKIDRVYLDFDYVYWTDTAYDKSGIGNDTFIYPHLSFQNRLSYLKKYLLAEAWNRNLFDYRLTANVIMNNIPNFFHTLFEKNFVSDYMAADDQAVCTVFKDYGLWKNYEYQGRGYIRGIEKSQPTAYTPPKFEGISEHNLEVFEELVSYCNQNQIELICVIIPMPPAQYEILNFQDMHQEFSSLCQKYNVSFYDFNYINRSLWDRTEDNYLDTGGHLMGIGSDKQSELLLKVLASADGREYFYESHKDVLDAYGKIQN